MKRETTTTFHGNRLIQFCVYADLWRLATEEEGINWVVPTANLPTSLFQSALDDIPKQCDCS